MRRVVRILGPAGLLAAAALPVLAADVSGSARIQGGTTETGEREEDQLAQDYAVQINQPITPWLRLFVAYTDNRFETTSADGLDFDRRSRQPLVQLSYDRGRFDAALGFSDRRTRGSGPADTLDVQSWFGRLSWRPQKGPRYSLRLRDESNVADVAVFGRDVDTRALDFDLLHSARWWNLRYAFNRFELDNRTSGFRLDQDRHLLRFDHSRRLWGDRVALSTGWRLTRNEQREEAPAGAGLAEPLAAIRGLTLIDPTPQIGELEPVPTLIDGDTVTPAVPRIEIGGANTFRNVGLDLGFSRQVSRLEITVDAVSDPTLLWEVYHSSDNLNWERLAGAVAEFDVVFLRYTLRFPEATAQYWKAVNVSVNQQPAVAVTEIRALLDVERLGRLDRRSDSRRASVAVNVTPSERLSGSFSATFDEDDGSNGGLPAQDSRQTAYEARVRTELTPSADARFHYTFSQLEREQQPVLRRDERRYGGSLHWSPLPTVDTVLSLTRRSEYDDAVRLRSSDTYRLRSVTELYDRLSLTSELAYATLDDPQSGFELSSWTWRETLESRPFERLTFGAGVLLAWFDSSGTVSLERRVAADVRSQWIIAPLLTLNGQVSYGEEDDRETVSQRYNLNWTPGPKLALSASYFESDSLGVDETRATAANLSYRMNRRLNLFASFSRSVLERAAEQASRVTSLTAGMTLSF